MTLFKFAIFRVSLVGCFGVALGANACKDDDPCDANQEESEGLCYDVAMGGTSAAPGTAGTSPDAGADAAAVIGADFGTPCADTVSSSDCGGNAPLCAPFPAGSVCTQTSCQAGEVNAGVCPEGWQCVTYPGNPSVCFGS
jgi:hypothetical protein